MFSSDIDFVPVFSWSFSKKWKKSFMAFMGFFRCGECKRTFTTNDFIDMNITNHFAFWCPLCDKKCERFVKSKMTDCFSTNIHENKLTTNFTWNCKIISIFGVPCVTKGLSKMTDWFCTNICENKLKEQIFNVLLLENIDENVSTQYMHWNRLIKCVHKYYSQSRCLGRFR